MEETNTKIVMVVEDEDLLLEAIDKKLKSRGYTSLPYRSAEEALTYLHEKKSLPHIIWLDYYLGPINGNDFVEELKKDDQLSPIPVIIVSNSASDEKKNAMLALGVKAYILKAQYKLDDIITLLENVMKDNEIPRQF